MLMEQLTLDMYGHQETLILTTYTLTAILMQLEKFMVLVELCQVVEQQLESIFI